MLIRNKKKLAASIFKLLFTVVGAGLGLFIITLVKPLDFIQGLDQRLFTVISVVTIFALALIFFILSPKVFSLILYNLTQVENELKKRTLSEILMGSAGLILGLVIAFLLSQPISMIPVIGSALPLILYGILGYLGINLALKYKDDIVSKTRELAIPRGVIKDKDKKTLTAAKILDTSVIIDGRIKEVVKSGFVEGQLIVSKYVLEELQHIADSSDSLKRNRGRRGLDILKELQDDPSINVVIFNEDYDTIKEVDSKLIQITKDLKGKIVTNDFNLNKVATVQNVAVLNINELANAVKPVYLPGEIMHIQIVKPGKETGQGLAYLDDGTMIVVEDAKHRVGDDIDVMVTSALQTSAGKMIFARPL
ncbi:PIN/TRAM domain-containing protein [Peptoniphilus equinus]|uniref:PIN/TRAM domain-containing protein n=1 Tax=Peptoniphilus equinus TaxID=3016343 RepID=A0ABY7QVF9_9FIRM|nr:PIN/TRAM domain-containing protein [Peptoniphilus equinus]